MKENGGESSGMAGTPGPVVFAVSRSSRTFDEITQLRVTPRRVMAGSLCIPARKPARRHFA